MFLCSFVFAFNNAAGEKAGYSIGIVYFNCLLFIVYFLITVFLLTAIFKAYQEKVQSQVQQKAFRDLQNYTQNIETMYKGLRSFKHDYINILTSLSGYIESGDLENLRKFFSAKILPTGMQIKQDDYKLNQLGNIGVTEIKSLLSAKMIYARQLGIEVTIDIPDIVNSFPMDTVDLARILGIFLDNAIEASIETPQPELGLNIIQNTKTVAIIISNSFCIADLPIHKLKQQGFTTKQAHHGIGLSNAHAIISTYENVLWETSKQSDIFSQYMEIALEKEKEIA